MSDSPDSPGRAVRMSALGLMSEALIPKACRSCGVATYTGPLQERPAAPCWRPALGWSSSVMSCEPRAEAMPWAVAAWACGVLAVPDPPDPLPGPPPGVYTMIWLEARFGPA